VRSRNPGLQMKLESENEKIRVSRCHGYTRMSYESLPERATRMWLQGSGVRFRGSGFRF
jgi:hypothetical protein